MSARKLEANRRNALQSTGPRTARGKAISSKNALKHGLLAREVVIQRGDGKEDKAEFDRLLAQLWQEQQPQGVLEEMLVEKIAVSYWRLVRVMRCEIGEIRKQLDTAIYDAQTHQSRVFRMAKQIGKYEGSGSALKSSTVGILHLIKFLDRIAERVDRQCSVSPEELKEIVEHFGYDVDGFAVRCAMLNEAGGASKNSAEQANGRREISISPQMRKEMLLKTIREEQQDLSILCKVLERNEELELESRVASLSLAPAEATERILRYETTIERELYRALDQLERLQRRRQGEAVPPPVSARITLESSNAPC